MPHTTQKGQYPVYGIRQNIILFFWQYTPNIKVLEETSNNNFDSEVIFLARGSLARSQTSSEIQNKSSELINLHTQPKLSTLD